MSSFYTGLASTANSLLASKGRLMTVRRDVTTIDKITSESTTTSFSDQNLSGVILAGKSGAFDSMLPEDEVIGSTKSIIISTVGSTFQPKPLDKIVIDADVWLVYGVSKVDPTDTNAVIYKLGIMYSGLLANDPPITGDHYYWVSAEEWVSADLWTY